MKKSVKKLESKAIKNINILKGGENGGSGGSMMGSMLSFNGSRSRD